MYTTTTTTNHNNNIIIISMYASLLFFLLRLRPRSTCNAHHRKPVHKCHAIVYCAASRINTRRTNGVA